MLNSQSVLRNDVTSYCLARYVSDLFWVEFVFFFIVLAPVGCHLVNLIFYALSNAAATRRSQSPSRVRWLPAPGLLTSAGGIRSNLAFMDMQLVNGAHRLKQDNWYHIGWLKLAYHFFPDTGTYWSHIPVSIIKFKKSTWLCGFVRPFAPVVHVLDRKLLERLMSPSPKSQVMFASAFSWIGDFFRIFGIHIFQVMASFWI